LEEVELPTSVEPFEPNEAGKEDFEASIAIVKNIERKRKLFAGFNISGIILLLSLRSRLLVAPLRVFWSWTKRGVSSTRGRSVVY